MNEFLIQYYDWLRALHIISVISWMAGMLYLPRLFVYHTDARFGFELDETLKIMEPRLLRIIMNPAMAATWIFGGLMLYVQWDHFISQPWMHAKLTCVILMTGVHHLYVRYMKAFAANKNKKSAKFFRILNEVPTILMVVIVIMAVVEPF